MTDEEKFCETCDHIEMCKWTPISGCAFHSKYEKRPHGEWINTGEAIGDDIEVKCSLCGEELYWLANFCPNCGADMRKEGGDS